MNTANGLGEITLMELSDIADRQIKPRLQTIPGVSGAPIFGERRFSMRVWLSPRELAARGLTAADVEQAIRTRSVEIPAGRIESDRRELSVRYLGEMRTPEEFAQLTVANGDVGGLVKLGDVARVEPGPEDERSVTRYSARDAVFIGVVRQSKSNVLEVASAVHAGLPAIQAALPAGVELAIAFDGSVFVQRSIQEARETLVITAVLVIIIIFLFLRTLRATAIPAIAIPVSIISTFAVLAALGYSVNTLTLLGLILAIGIVVDDAIIVMENAYRHQEELHKDPETAAIDGTREITTAVIATTIALLAVFSPLLFLTGATGRLFTEFAVAVGGSVLVSGIVALTLTPMLSAKILRATARETRFQHVVGAVLDGITARYGRTLEQALTRPFAVIGGGLALTASAVLLFMTLKREFVPPDDRGFFFTWVVGPEGATVAYTDDYVRQIEAIALGTEGMRSSFAVIGFPAGPSSGIVGPLLSAERAGYWPDVTLGAATGAYDSQFFPSALRRSQLAITVTLPIWDGGRRELAVARARARRDVARAVREDSERAAAALMAEAHHGYETSRAGTEMAQVGVAVATENYRVQRARYREGATTILDLLEAQVALSEAEAALVQARYAARLALAEIEALLGRRII